MATLNATEWSGILDRVQNSHPNLARQWFDELNGGDLEYGVLEIRCANLPQQRYLGAYCTRPFCEAAQAETGRLVSVRFSLADDDNHQGPGDRGAIFTDSLDHITLNPEYEFDGFITGPCNRLAHAACMASSQAPGQTYNPLFIHGDVGLGKTHLLQAICQSALNADPCRRILYLSCETFINHFIEAVERGALHQFRARYRHVDILAIDDIQFLAGKERSQEEFFHTFNTLYQAGKQIVLSADCSPREIPQLEDRLISRFSWGLVVRIDKPCLETRIAIVRKKLRLRGICFPKDVTNYIAVTIDTNTRELEGAITAVDASSQQLGKAVDLASAQAALNCEITQPSKPISIRRILDKVSEHYNVKKPHLQGKRRTKSIALPRQVSMYLARTMTSHSLEEIGRHFGGRDHTTVIHATRRITKLQQEDPNMSRTLEHLKSLILQGEI